MSIYVEKPSPYDGLLWYPRVAQARLGFGPINSELLAGPDGGVYTEPSKARSMSDPQGKRRIPVVHLSQGRSHVRRDVAGSHAHPLGEPNLPRRTGDTPDEQVKELLAIVDALGVENSARYRRTGKDTYCNVYAHDYCYLADAYLPRVWWTPNALVRLAQGQSVEIKYTSTVEELKANELFDWLPNHGPNYGWRGVSTLDALQTEANAGKVCLIVAQNKRGNGHITVVIPEHEGHTARRDSTTNKVILPLQSQAGGRNEKVGQGGRAWWDDPKHRLGRFYVHP